MAIKSIVVHPKGATHIQTLVDCDYFMKFIDGIWFYYAQGCKAWNEDPSANNDGFVSSYLASLIKPIR